VRGRGRGSRRLLRELREQRHVRFLHCGREGMHLEAVGLLRQRPEIYDCYDYYSLCSARDARWGVAVRA
jgi:hypothetical protein